MFYLENKSKLKSSLYVILCTLFLGLMTGCDNPSKTAEEKEKTRKEARQKQKEDEEQVVKHHPNGEPKIVGKKKNGERDGVWTSWYKDGTQWSEITYEMGSREGPTRTWYQNGQLRYKGRYENDEPAGTWFYYDRSGNLVEKKNHDANDSSTENR